MSIMAEALKTNTAPKPKEVPEPVTLAVGSPW